MSLKAGTNGVKPNVLQSLVKMLNWFSTNQEALDDLIEGAPHEPKSESKTVRKTTKKTGGD